MTLQVLLFGIATDLVGTSSLDFELPIQTTVHDFKTALQTQFPNLSEINSYAIAVNESYATSETILTSRSPSR